MIIRLLRESDRRESFDSGEHSLDDFFARHAWNNHINNISRVYVAVEDEAAEIPRGYYTLSAADVEPDHVAEHLPVPLPRYAMPAVKIGRLAVEQRFRGQGMGRALLRHALRNSSELAHRVAATGVLVDAFDSSALSFYEQFGFVLIPPEQWPQPMFLPMETLRKALATA